MTKKQWRPGDKSTRMVLQKMLGQASYHTPTGYKFIDEEPAMIHGYPIRTLDGDKRWVYDIVLSAFHFLVNRMTYQAKMTAAFHRWCKRRDGNLSYFDEIEAWLNSLKIEDVSGDNRPIEWMVGYQIDPDKNEGGLLSHRIRTIEIESYDLEDLFGGSDRFTFMTIDGRYDTRYRIFIEYEQYSLYDLNRATLFCDSPTEDHAWDTEDNGYTWTYEGNRFRPEPNGPTLFNVSEFNDETAFYDGLDDKRHLELTFFEDEKGHSHPLCPICWHKLLVDSWIVG